jgi:FeS assembly SUF system protein
MSTEQETATAATTDAPLSVRIEAALRMVHDPEIPVNIYDLGLIYGVEIADGGAVHVTMTLTTPNCPAAVALPGEVEAKVRAVEGVTDARVSVVWDPPWDQSRMSDAAKLELGLM